MKLTLANLGDAPFRAEAKAGSPAAAASTAAAAIQADERSLAGGLTAGSQPGVDASLLADGRGSLLAITPAVHALYLAAAQKGGVVALGADLPPLVSVLTNRLAGLGGVLDRLGRADAARAARARSQSKVGATAALLLLLAAFAYFYFRSIAARETVEQLANEKQVLLGESRVEARTDALTDLANRRALGGDLTKAIAEPPRQQELLLAMFDLDGFKQYNDTFGHAAGDALLRSLGGRLAEAAGRIGSAYRMGGDEFCLLARCSSGAAEQLLDDAIGALQASGEGWQIGSSHGAVWIPSEAETETQALALADERMYANKASRSSASRQVTDALLQVITEQNACLDEHVERVSELAGAVAEALGKPEHEIWRVRLAGRLHDVGKTAIPAAILDKPGPLDAQEWEFMRRHPLIGERIVTVAPALASTAELIRSTHERVDGCGYPDGLSGEDIPMGSRIIAVCDAFDAMTSERPYRGPTGVAAALAELRSHAGTQFDADVVEAFCSLDPVHHGSDDGSHTSLIAV
jgi:diguanylate cyclase (GGDEF)-like protein